MWNFRRKRRRKRDRRRRRGRKKMRKGRRPGLRLKGYKAAGIQGRGGHKERMMKMTLRMSRPPRGGAAKRTRKREEIKEPALARRRRGLQRQRRQAR